MGDVQIQGTYEPNGNFPAARAGRVRFDLPLVPYVLKTIYVRSSGSDTRGQGTLASPYATIVRALRDIPFGMYGTRFTIDCDGLTEINAEALRVPQFQGSGWFDELGTTQADLTIRAPLTTIQSVLPANIVGSSAQSKTGNTIYQTNLVLVPGALVGKQVFDVDNDFYAGMVIENTVTDITVSDAGFSTTHLEVREPTSEIRYSGALGITFEQAGIGCSLVLDGFKLMNLGAFPACVFSSGNLSTTITRCEVVGAIVYGANSSSQNRLDLSWVHGAGAQLSATGASLLVSSCVLEGAFLLLNGNTGHEGVISLNGCSFDGCNAVGNVGSTATDTTFDVSYCWVWNSTGHGISLPGGARHRVTATLVDDSAGDGVFCGTSSTQVELGDVGGTGNTGVGLRCINGARAQISPVGSVDVTGAGGDLKVGLLPAIPWASFNADAPIRRRVDLHGDQSAVFRTDSTAAVPPVAVAPSAIQTLAFTALIDQTSRVDPSGGGFTVTLPTAVGIAGHRLTIKNVTASVNAIVVDGTGAETIDGAATVSMTAAFQFLTVESDGTNWMVVGT